MLLIDSAHPFLKIFNLTLEFNSLVTIYTRDASICKKSSSSLYAYPVKLSTSLAGLSAQTRLRLKTYRSDGGAKMHRLNDYGYNKEFRSYSFYAL